MFLVLWFYTEQCIVEKQWWLYYKELGKSFKVNLPKSPVLEILRMYPIGAQISKRS